MKVQAVLNNARNLPMKSFLAGSSARLTGVYQYLLAALSLDGQKPGWELNTRDCFMQLQVAAFVQSDAESFFPALSVVHCERDGHDLTIRTVTIDHARTAESGARA